MDDNNEDKIEQQQHILNYCFSALEYIRNCDPEMFKRAKEYAEDQTGVEIDPLLIEQGNHVIDYLCSIYGWQSTIHCCDARK